MLFLSPTMSRLAIYVRLSDDFCSEEASFGRRRDEILTICAWYVACSHSLLLWLQSSLTTTQTSTATGAGRRKLGFANASARSKRASTSSAASQFLAPRSLGHVRCRAGRKKIRSRSTERRTLLPFAATLAHRLQALARASCLFRDSTVPVLMVDRSCLF